MAMARNQVQLQKGLSSIDFLDDSETEEARFFKGRYSY